MCGFSPPGHAGVLGNERADVLAGSAEIRGTLMDHPAVRAAVQEILTDTRTEVSFTLDLLDSWRWQTRHASWASQATSGSTPKMDTTAESGVFMDDHLMTTKTPDSMYFKVG